MGNVSNSYSGGTPSASRTDYYGGKIPFIRSAEINSNSTELYLTESGFKNSSAKMVQLGDILYALYGATSGEVGISKINGAINQDILTIKPTEGDNAQFIMQWLKGRKGHIVNTYLQGGQGNLSGSIIKNLEIMIPDDKKEEIKIGEFLQSIDNLITVNQRLNQKSIILLSNYIYAVKKPPELTDDLHLLFICIIFCYLYNVLDYYKLQNNKL
ncbi:type I restriction enzyme, S subunit [Weissella hellenica]|uniref:Type I restriction enzyme, S subunit n=1 Tax=Weissella hellenica TaxID=46256 RepID=A0ABY0K033_WEIHE|nr:hypothetical protein WHE01_03040 [Weissella hellenica]SCB74158.1 type I restriction enzyme, S subunit [Weissella hellenica]